MHPVYWALAIAVLAVCMAAFVWIRIKGRVESRLPPEAPIQELPPENGNRSDEVSYRQAVAATRIIHLLKSRYDSAARAMAIPSAAVKVPVNAAVFGLEKREILHYLWETEPGLYLFPVWEEIRGIFENAGGAFSFQPGDENDLSAITIPKNRVDFWRVLQSGGVEVFYTNAAGERVGMILRGAQPEPFRSMLPNKEESYIISYIYPKSSKNIFDIKGEFYDLKARRQRGEVSQDEFDREKKILLITM